MRQQLAVLAVAVPPLAELWVLAEHQIKELRADREMLPPHIGVAVAVVHPLAELLEFLVGMAVAEEHLR